jgi:hypothetical protein
MAKTSTAERRRFWRDLFAKRAALGKCPTCGQLLVVRSSAPPPKPPAIPNNLLKLQDEPACLLAPDAGKRPDSWRVIWAIAIAAVVVLVMGIVVIWKTLNDGSTTGSQTEAVTSGSPAVVRQSPIVIPVSSTLPVAASNDIQKAPGTTAPIAAPSSVGGSDRPQEEVKWQLYAPEGVGFSIEMPVCDEREPIARESGGYFRYFYVDPEGNFYQVSKYQGSYDVEFVRRGILGPQEALKEMAETGGGEIVNSKFTPLSNGGGEVEGTIKGCKYLADKLVHSENPRSAIMRVRIVMSGGGWYSCWVNFPVDGQGAERAERYLRSFKTN